MVRAGIGKFPGKNKVILEISAELIACLPPDVLPADRCGTLIAKGGTIVAQRDAGFPQYWDGMPGERLFRRGRAASNFVQGEDLFSCPDFQ